MANTTFHNGRFVDHVSDGRLICSRYSKQCAEVECGHLEGLLLSSVTKTLCKHLLVCSCLSNISLVIKPQPERKETKFT